MSSLVRLLAFLALLFLVFPIIASSSLVVPPLDADSQSSAKGGLYSDQRHIGRHCFEIISISLCEHSSALGVCWEWGLTKAEEFP